MPDADKNIVITPYRGSTLQPQVVFTGQGVDPITLRVLDGATGTGITAGGALSFEGSAGQLFSVVNRLGTGSIFSVNDISGIPSIDVDANGTIEFAPFTGYVAIGLTLPTEKLHVSGNVLASGRISAVGGLSASGGLGVTGGATFNGNVIVNAANTIFTEAIQAATSQLNIDNKASGARVQIGPISQGNDTHIFIRDAVSLINISNPFGEIYIGDPNGVDSGAYISFNASSGLLTGNNNNAIHGFLSTPQAQTGTTYTFTNNDCGKVLTFNNASAITVTIPTGLPLGFNCTVIQLGAGQVGFTNAAGVTLQSYGNQYKLIGQHASATLFEYSTNIVNLSGNLIV
jgi:hypothetical protein